MDLQIKPLALAVAMSSLSSLSIAETAPANPDEIVQSETVKEAEEASSETVESVSKAPVESVSDPLSVQFTEAQAASLDFATFDAFKQSLSAVLTEVLPEEMLVTVSEGLQLISLEADAEAATSSDLSLDMNQLFDGFFEAQQTEGFSALSYKKELLLNLGPVYGFEVSFSVKATEVIADERVLPEKEESGFGSAGVIAGLAGAGLAAGGGGGGGGGSSSSTTFLDESTTFTYDAALDATWVARQEYKNSIYGAGDFNGTASTINPYTLVGINNAYARGLSGAGKVVAVYDTEYHLGTHLEMADKNTAGKITNDGVLTAGSDLTSWHGQHVAGTIAADYNNNDSNFTGGVFGDDRDYGMMGVAYNASLHLSDFADTSVYANYQDRLNAAIAAAEAKNAIAQNNSWGWGTCQTGSGCTTIDELVTYQTNNGTSDAASLTGILGGTTSKWSDMITAYNSFQDVGLVIFANGNDHNSSHSSLQAGLPVVATELADAWLTVGNLNVNGSTISAANITRIGNACGVAAEFCIYADGTDIWSSTGDANTGTNNEYSTYTGSSMAAPIVSGAVALLSEAFPNHTPAQLQDRILASANNDFFTATGTTSFINGITHGYNSEFGHGLLDLAAALGPISTSSIVLPSATNASPNNRGNSITSGQRFSLTDTRIKLSPAFGDSFQNALNGKKAYFYDALNGGFAFNLSGLVHEKPSYHADDQWFSNVLGSDQLIRRDTANGMSFLVPNSHYLSNTGELMAFIPSTDFMTTFIGNNINVQNGISASREKSPGETSFDTAREFYIPFLAASENGTSSGVNFDTGDGVFSLGVFDGSSDDFGLPTKGFISEYGKEFGRTYVSTFFGLTNETDGFLETSVEGAFAQNAEAYTKFVGITSYGWLGRQWSYRALASVGLTDMQINGAGMLNDLNNVTTSSFALEFARTVGMLEADSIHLGVFQPLRVEAGQASVSVPGLYNVSGELEFTRANVDLAPSGRQIDLGVGYQASIFDGFDAGLRFTLSQDYGHVESDDFAGNAVLFVKTAF
jgi:subtilase-type serine protease